MEPISKPLSSTVKNVVGSITESLLHLFCPPSCISCSRLLPLRTDMLCSDCWSQLQIDTNGDYCPNCGRDISRYAIIDNKCPDCQQSKQAFDGIARVGAYNGSLRNMILQFKFHEATEYKDLFCTMLRAVLEAALFHQEIDYFVPVPLHWLRRFQRGYNQATILSKGIASSKAAINTDIVRIKNTKRQWNLNTAKRVKNVKGAFAVRRNHVFSGKTICLVDDITTSHATLNECAAILKQVGAKKVYAAVLSVAAVRPD